MSGGDEHGHPRTVQTEDRLGDPERLALVRTLLREDAPLRGALDHITEVVSTALEAPIALVSIVDDRRQSFLSCVGLPPAVASGTPISHSFCQHVVDRDAPLIVRDAREDPLVSGNPSVDELNVIAYAGIPLRVHGQVVGSLCAIDHVPREWAALQIETLRTTADLVEYLIGTRTALVSRTTEAARAADLATRMQQALLAQPDPGTFRVDLTYQAGSRRLLLGGDSSPPGSPATARSTSSSATCPGTGPRPPRSRSRSARAGTPCGPTASRSPTCSRASTASSAQPTSWSRCSSATSRRAVA